MATESDVHCQRLEPSAGGVRFIWALLVFSQAFFFLCDARASDGRGPAQVMDAVAKSVLSPIDAHPDQYQAGSPKLNQLVNATLMPYFDTNFAAQFVLGPYWRSASAKQRALFVDGFSWLLLHNCANDLVQFSADHLQVLPYRGDPSASYATVDTKMHRRTGEVSDLSFSMRKTASGWKAYDVAIDGVSYDKGFRDDFQEEIEQKGLDELISRLKQH